MKQKVSRVGSVLRHFFAAALLASPVAASAQCVVGGTNFDTKAELCNPDLTDDDNGWFSEDVGDLIDAACKGNFSGVVTNVKHLGLQSNACSSGGSDKDSFDDICTSAAGNKFGSGYSAVVGNPRVISPYFTDNGKNGNMFVNIGTSQSEAFLTYSVSGLEPGSTVNFSCDVTSLLSPAELEIALEMMNQKATKLDLIREIKIGPLNFGMQSSGNTLTPGSGKINGNGASVYVCTGGIVNNQAAGDVKAATPGFGETSKITMTTKADKNGQVSFYFGRKGGSEFAPVGIDNIKIEGNIMPEIYSQKKLPVCPANPVLLGLKQSFPEGTTYSWSAVGISETSDKDGKTFTITPMEADKSYKVSCKVTMGTCSATANIDVTTKQCCSMKNDEGEYVPVAQTFVVYEDFGEFTNNGTMYTHTDEAGNTVSMKVQGGMYNATDLSRPYVTYKAPGVTTGIPAAVGNSSSPNDCWMISNVNPYTPGVSGDASGTGNGGMLIFDLSGGDCGGKPIKDMVIYSREVKGLCMGKEISFSALFGAINSNPSGVGEMKIILREGNKIIYDSKEAGHSKMLYGNEGWLEASHKFELDHDVESITFEVVNVADNYPTSAGDMAVDNIIFSVCTPPDVAVESSLTAAELLDLCSDKPLTLNAQISDAAKKFYSNKEGYLFQYTYDDPATTDDSKIVWHDLSTIQSQNGEFTITDPANHEAFAPLKLATKGDLNVYFRVVIGEENYLNDKRATWEKQSALSPCRAISISSIPIVAALNCAKCYNPEKVEITDKAAATNVSTKKLTLCAGDAVTLSPLVTSTDDDGNPYNNYYLFWQQDGKDITGYTKLSNTGTNKPLVIENDGSYSKATDVVITLIAADTFEFAGLETASCKDSKEITITMLPKPEALDAEGALCFGDQTLKTGAEPTSTAGTITFYEDATATTEVAAPIDYSKLTAGVHNMVYTVTSAEGCVSEAAKYDVTVNSIPNATVAPDQYEFCAKSQKSEIELPTTITDANTQEVLTIDWGKRETDLSQLAGSKIPYEYTYKVTNAAGCELDGQKITINAKLAVVISNLNKTEECDNFVVNFDIEPAEAKSGLTYTLDGVDFDFDGWTGDHKKGELGIHGSYQGYCDASAFIDIDTKINPTFLITTPTDYVKKTQAVDKVDIKTKNQNLTPSTSDGNMDIAELELEYSADAYATEAEALAAANTATYTNVPPVPQAKALADPNTEIQFYLVRIKNKITECVGEARTIQVNFFGAPVPDKVDATYCIGDVAQPLSEYASINYTVDAGGSYELTFYSDATKSPASVLPATTVPSTAAAGQQFYYVTQTNTDPKSMVESEPAMITITTYGVLAPNRVTTTDSFYCVGNVAADINAYISKNEDAGFNKFTGFQWKENGVASPAAPVISTTVTGATVYSVNQYYDIMDKDGVTKLATCVGNPIDVTITVQSTTAPSVKDVSYLYSQFETNGNKFDALNVQEPGLIADTDKELYNYEYAECDVTGTLRPGAEWSATVPTPDAVTKAELNGGSKTVYYAVRRKAKTGAMCTSPETKITVTISDAPMPIAPAVYFCEGATTIPNLDALVTEGAGLAGTTYKLVWYETATKPTAAEILAGTVKGSYTAPAKPSAVADKTNPKVYSYYVAQEDQKTGAVGAVATLEITVYPKPVQTIDDPAAVCAPSTVDLSKTVTTAGDPLNKPNYVTAFFKDQAGTTSIAKDVAVSGTYYAMTAFTVKNPYNALIAEAACASNIDPIKVTVDTLKLLTVKDDQTCPNTAGKLEAEIETNVETAATFTWKGQKAGSGEKVDANTDKKSEFTTATLAGNAGDEFNFDVTVTAGTCTAEQKFIKMTLGDGPVDGKLTLTQDAKLNAEPEAVFTQRDNTDEPFYACLAASSNGLMGGNSGIVGIANFKHDAGTGYLWKGPGMDAGGTKDDGTGVTFTKPGTYTVEFTNECWTSVTFEVIDASILVNEFKFSGGGDIAKDQEELKVCENANVDVKLEFSVAKDANFANVEWEQPTKTYLRENGGSLTTVDPTLHTGKYTYTITNKGCVATGYVDLKVRPYVKFSADKYSYIARRDSQLSIVTNVVKPVSLPATTKYEWKDQNGFEMTGGTTKLDYTVQEDKNITVTIPESDDFCEGKTEVEVLMDGRLQLSATVKDQMCRGDKGVYLEIDTTGTGKLVKKNEYKLEITETLGTISHILNAPVQMFNGIMKYEIHPTEDATYTITASYRNNDATATPVDVQLKNEEVSITVLQPIMITVPKGLRACDGDELEITLESVTPAGKVKVNWSADNTIQGNTDDTESITVKPVYDEATGHNHKSTKVYNLTATMDGCADKDYKVNVTVDEPIEGSMSDTTICEGYSVRLDASNYQATEYVWTTASVGNDLSKSASLVVSPDRKTIYTIDMTRGKCTATEHVTVNVNEKPKIAEQVDSVGIRSRIIVLENESSEAMPYTYYIDGKEEGQTSAQFDSLRFSGHTVVVEDRFGCLDTVFFTLIAPPVNIPIWFSPNGDGSFDNWECPEITNVYPEAEVKIFDRWGKELAKFTGADGGWDGTYNGNPMPSTDYWYEIHVREIDKVYTGHFTLIRR